MAGEMDLQDAIDMVDKWDKVHQDRFYKLFPQTVQQEKRYDEMGFQQHRDGEGFATELEGKQFDKSELDKQTHESLQKQLATLSSTAGREAAAAQNLTVYNDTMELWDRAENTNELLEYLEAYAEKRSQLDERTQLEEPEDTPFQTPRTDYGFNEETEYVEEVLTQLVTETMHEV